MNDLARLDEIHFWGHQLMEHALFLHLGLEEESLKAEAKVLHDRWHNFMKVVFGLIDEHKLVLEESDLELINTEPLIELEDLIRALEVFKVALITRLDSGEWLGWIFPQFAKHLLRELHFFKAKLTGLVPPELEVKFWNVTNGEHAGITARLLDPNKENMSNILKAEDYQMYLVRLAEENPIDFLQYLAISAKVGKELDQFTEETQQGVLSGSVKSIIHPEFIHHDLREGKRAMLFMSSLLSLS